MNCLPKMPIYVRIDNMPELELHQANCSTRSTACTLSVAGDPVESWIRPLGQCNGLVSLFLVERFAVPRRNRTFHDV